MSMISDRAHQDYWRSQFLLNVRVETAPAELVYDAMGELRGLLAPIATSNRAFLNAVSDILRATKDRELSARGAEPVRLGLIFDDIERDLDHATRQVRSGDEESLFNAARIAQIWGWLAIKLRDELNELARFVSQSSAAAQGSSDTAGNDMPTGAAN